MADNLVELVFNKIDIICPEETIKISEMDGKVTSLALQKLSRKKNREYTKYGNSLHFKALKKQMKERKNLKVKKHWKSK